MNLQLVTFETAVLGKSKGFDVKNATGLLFFVDSIKDNIIRDTGSLSDSYSEDLYDSKTDLLAPEQELLKMWLREKHNIFVEVSPTFSSGEKKPNNYDVLAFGKHLELRFDTYELALESALQYGLGLIKQTI